MDRRLGVVAITAAVMWIALGLARMAGARSDVLVYLGGVAGIVAIVCGLALLARRSRSPRRN